MPFITVGAENGHDVDLHYDDFGTGDPVVLIHGWPLSGRSWEGQVPALVAAGHRVIAYDRRGFGQSSQPWNGYDYDTFAADLDKLITELGLTTVTLIGFSMGGGELARYVSTYGTGKVAKLVFASAVPPYLWKSGDNPEGGVDQDLADWFAKGITGDRPSSRSRRGSHCARKRSTASFHSSRCEASTPCGPPSMTCVCAFGIACAVRLPDTSKGTMPSASPWMTSVGTSTFVRSSRKSVVANAAVQSSVPFGEASSAIARS
jgi:pimeloyl-ACP methyl ester carboxylesterase